MFKSKIELTLDFAEETRLKTPAKFFREVLGVDGFGSVEGEEHIVKRDEKAKFALSWRYSHCSMVQESKEDSQECIDLFISFLEKINAAVPIGKLSRTMLRVDLVFPSTNTTQFKYLELCYRKTFIKDNGLFENIYDSSVVWDMDFGQWKLHHQSGAMEVKQLQKDFREFKIKENHPTLFLFLLIQVTNNNVIEYYKESFKELISSGLQACESHANNFGKIVEGIL
jgi:hypothetical protein